MSDFISIRLRLLKMACLIIVTSGIAHGQTSSSDKSEWPSRMEALGNTEALSPLEKAAFQDDPKLYTEKRAPAAIDWLTEHAEKGQTYDQFRLIISRVKPRSNQQALCILPIGEFNTKAPSLETLRIYCERFFCLPTRILPATPIDQVPAKSRINAGTQKSQLLTTDLLYWLQTQKPKDAFAVIAVTMEDLYPHENWNFVFGQAFQQGGAGVFSFARYHPHFYDPKDVSDASPLILARSAKVLTHEMGHMFGLKHCVFYECIMNGSNHLGETDITPMQLCPVCLRKLHLSLRFDLIQREHQLLKFYEEQQFQPEADWSRRHLEKLQRVAAAETKP
ncbi:MAG: archaemetzincin [Verrucomicrobia bacterium]|nr:archaemetzincin [Verrucomicrobiota bacterium]